MFFLERMHSVGVGLRHAFNVESDQNGNANIKR